MRGRVRVLLDTHALLWWALGNRALPRGVRITLESLDSEVLVSAASAWEIATKVRIGKLPKAEGFARDLPERLVLLGFQELPVSMAHALRAGLLPGERRDPFDRILIAQSLAENVPIVSGDPVFDEYLVTRIWK